MQTKCQLAAAIVLWISSMAYAEPIVNVTLSIDKPLVDGKYMLGIGETATLSVFGQLKTGSATAGNGIFGWDVDLRINDSDIIMLDAPTLDRSGWTNDSSTSSDGTPTTWGLDAIYDTGEESMDLGIDNPVRFFSVQLLGVNPGITSLEIESDFTTGVDFLTWQGQSGGDYSSAAAVIAVAVPEPGSLCFFVVGILVTGLLVRHGTWHSIA